MPVDRDGMCISERVRDNLQSKTVVVTVLIRVCQLFRVFSIGTFMCALGHTLIGTECKTQRLV